MEEEKRSSEGGYEENADDISLHVVDVDASEKNNEKYTLSQAVDRVTANHPHMKNKGGWAGTAMMTVRSLGVIYGDIGTSPLYVISTVFGGGIPINHDTVLGTCSLIVWSLILVVTIKYVGLMLMQDNHGEGGIFALLSLIPPVHPRLKNLFILISLIGSSFVIGDGVITPAISVLSAIEGIQTQAAGLEKYVVWITAAILLAFFLAQRFGTSRIGGSFGPIMLVWFSTCAIFGIMEIAKKPEILAALSPSYGMKFLFSGQGGFSVLSSVVLCVTGVEALYADLGHFGRLPIRISWLSCAFVALSLNYLGQGAHLLRHPEDLSNLFYKSVPQSFFWPELILATLATVIASQAMVSGVFSLINQAVSFQFFPYVKIIHTSKKELGQIYIPELNYILMVLTLVIVFAFQTSNALSGAYGIAVTGVMCLTSVMYVAVLILRNHSAWWKIAIYSIVYFVIDVSFFASSLSKIATGGWLPVVIGCVFATIMFVWKNGKEATEEYLRSVSINYDSLKGLIARYDVARVPTIGVFMSSRYDMTPNSVSILLPRTRSLPNPCIFLTIKFVPVPYVAEQDRVTTQLVHEIDGLMHAVVLCGFAEAPNISEIVRSFVSSSQFVQRKSEITPAITYYITRERVRKDKKKWIGHQLWVRFYSLMLSSTRTKSDMFRIPAHEMVDVGCNVVL